MEENDTQNMGEGTERPRAGREMLIQIQQMIDTLATQAAPVMREVAAKAAELAAVAGEKAGPLAHKAAGMTESMGQRMAARSKEVAADLRRPRESATDEAGSAMTDESMADESMATDVARGEDEGL
jgi:hypothetical protein